MTKSRYTNETPVNPPSLRGHIVNAHLQVRTLLKGIPNYDLEKLSHYGQNADWVAKKIMERLAWSNNDLKTQIEKEGNLKFGAEITLDQYKTKLVQTLIAIKFLALSDKIDVEEVYQLFPQAKLIELNWQKDCYEGSYHVIVLNRPLPYYYELKINFNSPNLDKFESAIDANHQNTKLIATELTIDQKPSKKEIINQLNTKTLTLGFLSSDKYIEQRIQQQQTYCGLRKGFLC